MVASERLGHDRQDREQARDHFPLLEIHPNAELAAEAAEAVAAQGQFWAMHHQLFTQTHDLSLPGLTACTASIGLDMQRFSGEMADRIYTQRVREHRRAAVRSGVQTTPTYFLSGQVIDVSAGFDRLGRAVAAALVGQGVAAPARRRSSRR